MCINSPFSALLINYQSKLRLFSLLKKLISQKIHLIFNLSNKNIFGWANSYIHKQPKKSNYTIGKAIIFINSLSKKLCQKKLKTLTTLDRKL